MTDLHYPASPGAELVEINQLQRWDVFVRRSRVCRVRGVSQTLSGSEYVECEEFDLLTCQWGEPNSFNRDSGEKVHRIGSEHALAGVLGV